MFERLKVWKCNVSPPFMLSLFRYFRRATTRKSQNINKFNAKGSIKYLVK